MCKPKRILIVDDSRDIVMGTAMRLRAAGYEVLSAFDGQQGIDLASNTLPDAILMDVRMPIKDGLVALAELKSLRETRDIPIVMLSASIVDQNAALEAGAHYFLRKPYDGRQLVETMGTVLAM